MTGQIGQTVLLEGHWYDAVVSLLDAGQPADLPAGQRARARELAVAARRILDLDAEDFGELASNFSSAWGARLAAASFPLEPRDPQRGALGSLTELYELMLEVLELRALRAEPLQIVVTAHLIGEYLAQLAWQPVLGHGGDPLRMAESIGSGTRWGTDDPDCPHSSALRATARRSLHACSGDRAGYTAYLDRFHSRLGEALTLCAMNHVTVGAGERPDVGETCPNPCAFATAGDLATRRDLDARVRLARIYAGSPIVNLRHHAPVGHFFGVPSVGEISQAWIATWEKLQTPWADGENPLLADDLAHKAEPGEALPGMAALVSAVAGRPMGPGRLIRDIGAELTSVLEGA
ncbi:hypothetical protein ACQCX2_09380 [Propionibacteriaceae bacterium Y1700]|uniref:hypothetical protein n=1 Tax=Microlunatus sp. Y1700 TaxID=3418487 RepID=UPI003DA77664